MHKKRKNPQKKDTSQTLPDPSKHPEQKEIQETITQLIAKEFHGPIPPPSILEGYENILPGSAERILSMAEKQASHRREIEKKLLNSDIFLAKRGQLFAFFITIFGFSAAVLLGYLGNGTAASIIGGGTLATIVSIFIFGKNFKK